jgi:cystathionine beta-lyase
VYDFDQIIPRRNTYSEKWELFAEDVLPLWVADMDFLSPEPVIRALRERVEHGVYGYGVEPKELRELLVARLQRSMAGRCRPVRLSSYPASSQASASPRAQ